MNTINLHELRHTDKSLKITGQSYKGKDSGKFGTITIQVGETDVVIFMEKEDYLIFCSDHNIDHQK